LEGRFAFARDFGESFDLEALDRLPSGLSLRVEDSRAAQAGGEFPQQSFLPTWTQSFFGKRWDFFPGEMKRERDPFIF
jgi:hypothetical protein